MKKHHPENERAKRRYLVFLREAKRQDEASVDAVAKAISRFEQYTKWRDFKTFHFEQAVGFKANLAKSRNQRTGKALSKATMNSTLRALKAFFQWLAMQRGYKSRLNYTDMEYFNLSQKDARVATARRERPVPTLDQIQHTIALCRRLLLSSAGTAPCWPSRSSPAHATAPWQVSSSSIWISTRGSCSRMPAK